MREICLFYTHSSSTAHMSWEGVLSSSNETFFAMFEKRVSNSQWNNRESKINWMKIGWWSVDMAMAYWNCIDSGHNADGTGSSLSDFMVDFDSSCGICALSTGIFMEMFDFFFLNHFMVMRSVRTWIRIIGWLLVSNETLNNLWQASVSANVALFFPKIDANVLCGWFTIFTTIVFRIDGDFVHARSGHVDFSDSSAASHGPVVTHWSAIWFNE